jgi:hypothetical protein
MDNTTPQQPLQQAAAQPVAQQPEPQQQQAVSMAQSIQTPVQGQQQPQMRIDENMLVELGLGSLSVQDKDDLLKQIYQTLEIRVGMKLAERMSDAQLKEFEQFINNKDDAGALRWLETNFPDYKQVVALELDGLKAELKRDADKIIAASAQAHSSPAQQSQPQQAPQPQMPVQPPQNNQQPPTTS